MIKLKTIAVYGCTAMLLVACGERSVTSSAVRQTSFPGQVSAGGGTSGEVLARNSHPETNGDTTGGTPFHAGGAGGTSGGTATAGTVQESGQGPSGAVPPADSPAGTPAPKQRKP